MKDIVKEKTLENIETYLKENYSEVYGMFQGRIMGGFAHVRTEKSAFFMELILDTKIERFYLDIYPPIRVEKPFRQMVHAYINEKTSTFKSGRIDIDPVNGEVKIRLVGPVVDTPISVETIDDIVSLGLYIAFGKHINDVEKLAHGLFPSEEEDKSDKMKRRRKMEDDSADDDGESFEDLLKKLSALSDGDSAHESEPGVEDSSTSDFFESVDFEDKTETEAEPAVEDEIQRVDVVLESCGEKHFQVVMCIKELTGVAVLEAKSLAESAPVAILENVPRDVAENAIQVLKEKGATAFIR